MTAETLAGVKAQSLDIWAECTKPGCQHTAVVPVDGLIAQLGETFPVPDLRSHLRCGNCRDKQVHVRPNWPTTDPITRHT